MSHRIDDGLNKNQRYYRKHKQESTERVRAWRAASPEAREKDNVRSRAYYAAHREELLAKASERAKRMRAVRKGTEAWRQVLRAQKAKRRAKVAEVENSLTVTEWLAICERYNWCCAYCGAPASTLAFPLEQDHKIPISKAGAHTAENVVPACKPCNSSKGNRSDRPIHR